MQTEIIEFMEAFGFQDRGGHFSKSEMLAPIVIVEGSTVQCMRYNAKAGRYKTNLKATCRPMGLTNFMLLMHIAGIVKVGQVAGAIKRYGKNDSLDLFMAPVTEWVIRMENISGKSWVFGPYVTIEAAQTALEDCRAKAEYKSATIHEIVLNV